MVIAAETEKTLRAEKLAATRDLILTTAERLFAEHGVLAVSNRQISETAGQGNNAAVGYHFGTKRDLIQAIVSRHTDQLERLRTKALMRADTFDGLRDWVDCLVRPTAEHLASLGDPCWFARFSAQILTDPSLREIMINESLATPSLLQIVEGMNGCLGDLPLAVRLERDDMVRQLLVHIWAERERAVAEGAPTPRASWDDAATGLIDAIVGIWQAPVTS